MSCHVRIGLSCVLLFALLPATAAAPLVDAVDAAVVVVVVVVVAGRGGGAGFAMFCCSPARTFPRVRPTMRPHQVNHRVLDNLS